MKSCAPSSPWKRTSARGDVAAVTSIGAITSIKPIDVRREILEEAEEVIARRLLEGAN